MTKRWSNDEEMLMALKKEIIRLGIQDNPSRTKYQENYDKTIAPSAMAAMNRKGLTWKELMDKIGLNYDGRAGMSLGGKVKKGGNKNSGRKGYSKLSVDDIFNMVALEIKINNYQTFMDYNKNHKPGTPSISTIYKKMGHESRKELLSNLSERLGYEIKFK